MSEYSTYVEWKKWEGIPDTIPAFRDRYFQKELAKTGLKPPARILEMGFGRGEFLKWARDKGYEVFGYELIEELVEKMKENGYPASSHNLVESADDGTQEGRFHLMVGFDVIEHLDVQQIRSLLKNSSEMMTEDAKFLFRFPNGHSPFGMSLYNGDFTHKTFLTRSKLEQILEGTDFRLRSFGNAARVVDARKGLGALKYVTFGIRNALELILGWAYFGCRLPMDKTAVAVIERIRK